MKDAPARLLLAAALALAMPAAGATPRPLAAPPSAAACAGAFDRGDYGHAVALARERLKALPADNATRLVMARAEAALLAGPRLAASAPAARRAVPGPGAPGAGRGRVHGGARGCSGLARAAPGARRPHPAPVAVRRCARVLRTSGSGRAPQLRRPLRHRRLPLVPPRVRRGHRELPRRARRGALLGRRSPGAGPRPAPGRAGGGRRGGAGKGGVARAADAAGPLPARTSV